MQLKRNHWLVRIATYGMTPEVRDQYYGETHTICAVFWRAMFILLSGLTRLAILLLLVYVVGSAMVMLTIVAITVLYDEYLRNPEKVIIGVCYGFACLGVAYLIVLGFIKYGKGPVSELCRSIKNRYCTIVTITKED